MRIASLWAAALIGAAAAASTPQVQIDHAWARATVPGASNGAAFMMLTARGEGDQLVGASSPVADRVDVHSSVMNNGVMEMRPVDVIDVVPGKPAKLAPGGLHLMLMGLKRPLVEGSTFPVTMNFRKSGAITVNVKVAGMGAGTAPD